jgi:hypothetical protein
MSPSLPQVPSRGRNEVSRLQRDRPQESGVHVSGRERRREHEDENGDGEETRDAQRTANLEPEVPQAPGGTFAAPSRSGQW